MLALRTTSALIALCLVVAIGGDRASGQAPGGRLKGIVASKTIKIAYRTDATPFSFVDSNKQVVGYTIDFCRQIVASLERQFDIKDLKVEWVPVTAELRFEAVAGGRADLECGSSTVTLGRMKLVDFSNFVFVESTGIVVRVASGIKSLKDIAGKKVAVIAGTSNERVIERLNKQKALNAVIVPVKDRDQAIAALDSAQVDAFANDKLLLVGTRFKDRDGLHLLPDDLSIEPYAIALPRGDWELRLAVNTALAEVVRRGEAERIFGRWFAQLGVQASPLLSAIYLLTAVPE